MRNHPCFVEREERNDFHAASNPFIAPSLRHARVELYWRASALELRGSGLNRDQGVTVRTMENGITGCGVGVKWNALVATARVKIEGSTASEEVPGEALSVGIPSSTRTLGTQTILTAKRWESLRGRLDG